MALGNYNVVVDVDGEFPDYIIDSPVYKVGDILMTIVIDPDTSNWPIPPGTHLELNPS